MRSSEHDTNAITIHLYASFSFGANRNKKSIGTFIIESFVKNMAFLKSRKYNIG